MKEGIISVTGPTPTYQVVFDLDGEGGGSGAWTGGGALTQTVSRLSAAVAPTVKPQAGYEFATWDTDFSAVKKDLTVRAVYRIAEVREATVTFDANGGTVSPATRTILKGEAVGDLPEPVWALCTFGGWFTSLNGGTRVTADTIVSGDVTYYAHWTPRPLTVTFDANGGTVSPATRTVDMGAALGGNLPTPTRTGHTFAGWYTAAEGGDPVTAETVVSSSATYYAHWTAIMKTVTFNANGGTVTPTTRSVAMGQAVLFLPDPSRRGYTFAGWWTAATGGARVTAETVVAADVTYYARWTAVTVQVTFDANGGTVSPSTKTVNVYSALGDNLPTPTRAGHAFVGWYTAADGGDPVTAETVVSAAATYYAHWAVITRTVTLDANGGTVEPATRVVDDGHAVTYLPTPSRNGYTFNGWWTAATGGTQVTAATVVSADVTYYAHWTAEVRATVTFNAVGGSVSPSSLTLTRGSSVGELPTPTRDGCVFVGWFTAESGGTQISADTVVSANVTFYAQYVAEVTFNANGGTLASESSTRTVALGSRLGSLPTPTMEGNAFVGWFTSAEGGTQVTADTVVRGKSTYYAHWTTSVRTVTVSFANRQAGALVNTEERTVAAGSAIGELPECTYMGWTFLGWFTSGGKLMTPDTIVTESLSCHAEYAVADDIPLTLPTPVATASPYDTCNVRLTWSEVPDATHYQIRRASAPNAEAVILGRPQWYGFTTGNYLRDAQVNPGSNYYYTVRAFKLNANYEIEAASSESAMVSGYAILGTEYRDEWDAFDNSPDGGTWLVPTTTMQTHGPHTIYDNYDKDRADYFRLDLQAGVTYGFEIADVDVKDGDVSVLSSDAYHLIAVIMFGSESEGLEVTYPMLSDTLRYLGGAYNRYNLTKAGEVSVNRFTFTPTVSKTYYLRSFASIGSNPSPDYNRYVTYSLKYKTLVKDEWDLNGDNAELSPTIEEQSHGVHTLDEYDVSDYFQIEMVAGKTYVFETAGDGDTYGELYSSSSANEAFCVASDDNGGDGGKNFKIVYKSAITGTHRLRVSASVKGTPLEYSLKYRMIESESSANNDFAFSNPSQQGWPSSCWLSDGNGMSDKSTFMTTNAISVHYAYSDAMGRAVDGHVNRVVVLRRTKWGSEAFDMEDYSVVSSTNMPMGTMPVDGCIQQCFTIPADSLWGGYAYAVLVWLDCFNNVDETDETNNWMVKTFTVSKPQVTVTFDANGGTVEETTRTVSMGNRIGSLPSPKRSGYRFDGWQSEETGKVTSNAIVSKDVTYSAIWTKGGEVTIWFYGNGGGFVGGYVSQYRKCSVGECIGTLPIPLHTNLVFDGWWTSQDGGEQVTSMTVLDTANSDGVGFYAHWTTSANQISITFDGNGGDVDDFGFRGNVVSYAFVAGSLYYLPETHKRTGYAFDGWFTERDGGVRVMSPMIADTDSTMYAHWIPLVSSADVQLRFDFQSAWGDAMRVDCEGDTTNRTDFVGSDKLQVSYCVEASGYFSARTNQVVLLRRTKGSSSQFDVSEYEIEHVIPSVVKCSLSNKGAKSESLSQWFLCSGDYAVYVILNNDKGIDADGDFKTQLEQFGEGVYWKMKQFTVTAAPVTVTFDANGGTVSEATRTVASGSTIGSLPTPTRSGYTFDGWYTAATGGTKVTTATTVLGNTTYYAHWSVKTTATVTFDANGGNVSAGETSRNTIGTLLSLPGAWHTNLVFAGWYTSKEGGTQVTQIRVYDDVTLYARWIEDADRVVVTLDGNGGVVYYGNKHAIAKGSGIAEFSYVRRSGYLFDGWFTEPDGGTRVMASTPVYSNVTWYAHWTKSVCSTNPHLEFYWYTRWGDSMFVCDDVNSVPKSEFTTAETIRVPHIVQWRNYGQGNNPTSRVQTVLLRRQKGDSAQFDVGDYEIRQTKSFFKSSSTMETTWERYPANSLEPGEYAVYVILNHYKEIDAKSDFKAQMAQFGEDVHWKMRQFTVVAAPVVVTFNANGGTVSPATRTVKAGEKIGELPLPVWKNHAFLRWNPSRSSYAGVTSETVVWSNVTYYAQWVGVYDDSADPKDDMAKGAVNWALKATPTKFERSLRSDDPEDNFKITGRDGALYDISLAFGKYQVGCDAVFSITNANGVTVCDVNGIPIDHVTSAKQIVLPKTKTPYYLTVTHGTPEKRSGNYTISGHYADVGAIKFAKTAVNVKESAAYVELTVNRTGKDGRVRVRYATADGTAKAGEDYQAASGVLAWADGDKKAKKIRIPLIPDLVAVYDGVKAKAFSVKLTPFTAVERAADEAPAVIAGGDTCTVTIAETSKPGTTVESVYAKQAAKRATVKTEDVPLESGTFYGLLLTDYGALTNGFPRLGSITFTASTAKIPALSAKVTIAGKTYSFSAKGWDDGWDIGICERTLVNVMKVGKAVYTNTLYVTVDSGSTTSATDWLQDNAYVDLTMNVPDANGKGVQSNVNYWNYPIYRNNAKIQSYLDVAQKFAGYYTMGLMGCNGGNGYLTMTVDNKGNAKIAGLLPDGTTKPSLSVKACGIREDSDSANGYAMYIPVFQAKSPYCFGGEIRLYALRDENAPDGSGMKIVVDENWSFMEWYNDKDAFGAGFYNDVFGETGFEEGMWACGGWYDKVVNLQRHYLDYALSVGTTKIDEFPYELLPGDDYSFVTAAQPDGFALTFENDKIVHDKKKIVKTNRLTDFGLSTNACNVSVKFTRATGVFTGGCSLWCTDEDGTKQKELTGFKAYGVFVLNRSPDDGASCLPDSILAPGCLTKKSKFTLIDEDTNRKTSVNWSFSVPFNVLGD